MPLQPEFITDLLDRLAPIDPIAARRMFGGWGLSLDGLTFALISGDVLYLKVDDLTRPGYEARSLGVFRPMADRPALTSYHRAPDEIQDDADELCAWARDALGAARRVNAAPHPKRRKAGPAA